MEIDNLEFADAVKHLAQNFNITLDIQGGDSKKFSDLKSQLMAIHEFATIFYQKALDTENGKKALVYLKERGLTDKMIEDLLEGFKQKHIQSISKLISLVENNNQERQEILDSIFHTQ